MDFEDILRPAKDAFAGCACPWQKSSVFIPTGKKEAGFHPRLFAQSRAEETTLRSDYGSSAVGTLPMILTTCGEVLKKVS
jgi:hypothetical protein